MAASNVVALFDTDMATLASVFLSIYGILIGSLGICGRFFDGRLHESEIESKLEAHRSQERMDNFFRFKQNIMEADT